MWKLRLRRWTEHQQKCSDLYTSVQCHCRSPWRWRDIAFLRWHSTHWMNASVRHLSELRNTLSIRFMKICGQFATHFHLEYRFWRPIYILEEKEISMWCFTFHNYTSIIWISSAFDQKFIFFITKCHFYINSLSFARGF